MIVKKMGIKPLTAAAVVGIVFGFVTVMSGGFALFGGPEASAAVGNAVPFVLWFNFLAGFAYIIAGAGLVLGKGWATWLSAIIALATIAIFAAFGLHIADGGAFEMRTVGAMSLRVMVWSIITLMAWRGSE
jgi:hypothetical protein